MNEIPYIDQTDKNGSNPSCTCRKSLTFRGATKHKDKAPGIVVLAFGTVIISQNVPVFHEVYKTLVAGDYWYLGLSAVVLVIVSFLLGYLYGRRASSLEPCSADAVPSVSTDKFAPRSTEELPPVSAAELPVGSTAELPVGSTAALPLVFTADEPVISKAKLPAVFTAPGPVTSSSSEDEKEEELKKMSEVIRTLLLENEKSDEKIYTLIRQKRLLSTMLDDEIMELEVQNLHQDNPLVQPPHDHKSTQMFDCLSISEHPKRVTASNITEKKNHSDAEELEETNLETLSLEEKQPSLVSLKHKYSTGNSYPHAYKDTAKTRLALLTPKLSSHTYKQCPKSIYLQSKNPNSRNKYQEDSNSGYKLTQPSYTYTNYPYPAYSYTEYLKAVSPSYYDRHKCKLARTPQSDYYETMLIPSLPPPNSKNRLVPLPSDLYEGLGEYIKDTTTRGYDQLQSSFRPWRLSERNNSLYPSERLFEQGEKKVVSENVTKDETPQERIDPVKMELPEVRFFPNIEKNPYTEYLKRLSLSEREYCVAETHCGKLDEEPSPLLMVKPLLAMLPAKRPSCQYSGYLKDARITAPTKIVPSYTYTEYRKPYTTQPPKALPSYTYTYYEYLQDDNTLLHSHEAPCHSERDDISDASLLPNVSWYRTDTRQINKPKSSIKVRSRRTSRITNN